MNDELAFSVRLAIPFEQALEQVTASLKEQGFGVLTRIDVRATLKEKLDADFRPYVILGACNPPLAHRALTADGRVGVMLPCNVTVEQDEDGVLVSFANPAGMLTAGELGESAELQLVARQAASRIQAAAESLSGKV